MMRTEEEKAYIRAAITLFGKLNTMAIHLAAVSLEDSLKDIEGTLRSAPAERFPALRSFVPELTATIKAVREVCNTKTRSEADFKELKKEVGFDPA